MAIVDLSLSLLFIVGTLPIVGLNTWKEYLGLFPSFARPESNPQNICLTSLLMLYRSEVQPSWQTVALNRIGMIVFLLAVFVVLIRGRYFLASSPTGRLAACAMLLCWLLIFSPLSRSHYYLYFGVFWGWYVYQMKRGLIRAAICLLIIGGWWIPLGGSGHVNLPLLLNFHAMWAALLAWCLSFWILWNKDDDLIGNKESDYQATNYAVIACP